MIVDLRTGFRPERTYNLVEAFFIHDRRLGPDIGYIDFGNGGNYREWFVGGGFKSLVSKHLTVVNEAYIAFASGPSSGGARYFWPWTGMFFSLSSKVSGEAVFFP